MNLYNMFDYHVQVVVWKAWQMTLETYVTECHSCVWCQEAEWDIRLYLQHMRGVGSGAVWSEVSEGGLIFRHLFTTSYCTSSVVLKCQK